MGGRYELVARGYPAEWPAHESLPIVDRVEVETIMTLGIDVLVIGPVEPAAESDIELIRSAGIPVVIVDPQDLSEAMLVYRKLAEAIDDWDAYARIEEEMITPLARRSASSMGLRRPLLAPAWSLDPLQFFEGHSFPSSLIEIGGGESLTHDRESDAIGTGEAALREAGVEALVYFVSPNAIRALRYEASLAERLRAAGIQFEVVVAETSSLWLASTEEVSARVESIIRRLREREAKRASYERDLRAPRSGTAAARTAMSR
jgi:hypothetical protein